MLNSIQLLLLINNGMGEYPSLLMRVVQQLNPSGRTIVSIPLKPIVEMNHYS